MYGLINKAVRGLVTQVAGEEAWARIRQEAGVEDDDFISLEGYDDQVTYRLVDAASKELNMPAEDVLIAFGKYWVEYTAVEGYGELLNTAGSTFPEFLENLDQLHSRVKLTFPNLIPPRFSVTDKTDDSLVLHYYSEREGLAPLVVGLLQGLGSRFHQDVTAEPIESGAGETDHISFRVTFAPSPSEHAST